MAYYYPGVNPYYPQPMQDNLMQLRNQFQPPQPMQPQAAQNGMIWVQGETGAKSYLVANGATVPLWDSETQTIYLKSTDASGIPSMRILDYTERTAAPRTAQAASSAQAVEYVPRSEFDALAAQVKALVGQKESKPEGKSVKEVKNDG